MKKYLFTLFIFLNSIIYSQIKEIESNFFEIYNKTSHQIVGIEANPPASIPQIDIFKSGRYYGTGIIISKDFILTTREVIQDNFRVRCIFFDKKIYYADVIAIDNSSHLVLIKNPRNDISPIILQKFFFVGQMVLSIGNCYNSIFRTHEATCSLGFISGMSNFKRGNRIIKNLIETDAAVNPGNYGGLLINLSGELCGITFSGYNKTKWLGLALTVEHINNFIEDYKKGNTLEVDLMILLETTPVYVGAKVDIIKGNIVFSEIEPGSSAESAGIREGDILLKIGDYMVNSPSHFNEVLQKYFPGQTVTFLIKRDNKLININVLLKTHFM